MNEQLRPSTLGEILDRTVQLYRRNFWLFVGVAVLPIVFSLIAVLPLFFVPGLAVLAVPGIHGGGAAASTFISAMTIVVVGLLAVPLYLAAYVYSTAGLTLAAESAHRGEKPTIREALKRVSPRFWSYLGLLLLQAVFMLLIPGAIAGGVIGGLVYAISQPGMDIGTKVLLGFVAFVLGVAAAVGIVMLMLGYIMGMAVCVVEQRPAWESMKRAWSLSRGTRGRIFVMYLLVGVLSMVVSMAGYVAFLIIVFTASLVGRGTAAAAAAAVLGGVLYFVVSVGGQLVLTPVPWIALLLFYYDQRVRKEGFDIEWMMQQAGLAPGQATGGIAQPAQGTLLVGGDAISGPGLGPDTVEER
jgi:hypothetical protein